MFLAVLVLKSLEGEIDYLPIRASFRAADADLLKLLIGPLYGDKPGIGMRELIQNAIDAVRELWQLGVFQMSANLAGRRGDTCLLMSSHPVPVRLFLASGPSAPA